jgi:hypothetical protein
MNVRATAAIVVFVCLFAYVYLESRKTPWSAIGVAARAKPFVGVVNKKEVHRSKCPKTHQTADAELVGFDSIGHARRAEFSYCQECRPDLP